MQFLLPAAARLRPTICTVYCPKCMNRSNLVVFSRRSASNGLPGFSFINELFLDLSKSSWVMNTQHLLESVHDYTHLPWWGTIVVTTASLRLLITLPLAAYQHTIFARLENLRLEMDGLLKRLKYETDFAVKHYKLDEKTAKRSFHKSAQKQWNLLVQRENCHPFKGTILLWGQIPLWVCMSVALRNMALMMPEQTVEAQILYLSLSSGGFGWIPNLTDVDHSLILPITMALANLTIIQLQVINKTGPTSRFARVVMNVLRGLCIVMVPIAANAPADVALYWTVSSLYGLTQNLVLLSPGFRRLCLIPKTPSERTNPYRHIYQQIKDFKWFPVK